MKEKALLAGQLFREGYNCCQSVILAFAPELGLDEKTAVRMGSSFGGGMGRLREVCGAVSGMFMVLGLAEGYDSPADTQGKAKQYARVQGLAQQFREKNGSIVCRELLGLSEYKSSPKPEERTEAYYRKRPCAELVECAAEILEVELEKQPI